MRQQRFRHEGHVDPEEQDRARGGDGQRGGKPRERAAVGDGIHMDRQTAIRVAELLSAEHAHLAAHRAQARDRVIEKRSPVPRQERLVPPHPPAVPARDDEADHRIRRGHDRRLNDQLTRNSAAGAPSGPRPTERPV